MKNIIRAEELYFNYCPNHKIPDVDKKWILENINFSIDKGEFIVVAGSNGSGKSTLLRLIDLLELPSKGKIYIYNKDASSIKDPYELRSKIGFVFQNPKQQIITGNVLDEITFGPENLGLSRIEIGKRINNSIELTGINKILDRGTDELSGGQRQLLAIASVLAMDPEIILFDEPTSMLHPGYHDRIIKIIKHLNEIGKTVILVTHNPEDFFLGNRFFVMNNGNLMYDSSAENLFIRNIDIVKSSGLEFPMSVRLSRVMKEDFNNFPVCFNLKELANSLTKRL